MRARDFWADINKDIAAAVDRIIPKRGVVDSVVSTGVKIIPAGSSSALGEAYARLAGEKLEAGDEVAYISLGGKPFILGRIWRGTPDAIAYDVPVSFLSGLLLNASALGVYNGAGSPESVVSADIGSIYLRSDGGAGTSVYMKESGAGNTGWVAISVSGGGGGSGGRVVLAHDTQNSPNNSSTTSLSTYFTNVDTTLALPSGANTWTILTGASGLYSHSTSGGDVRQISYVASDSGDYINAGMPSSASGQRGAITTTHSVAGWAGNTSYICYGAFRPHTSGTAYAGGGAIWAIGIEEV